MGKDVILQVSNVSKQYRLGLIGSGTISHDLNRWWAKLRGKEDPFLKIGESNNRTEKGNSQYVWALHEINFDVNRGEVLGIIGKNGAGKSTLLKILSQVTTPTTGIIRSKGRIASLLEVGTGFHPEMTGKENIFLNGAILGMNKQEIESKLEDIIQFSGCERYIDTPVKRYSSGMKVRLAFAVAAHLEPDILVVDEVLAVGDAEFQKKAIGKMQDIANSKGRTVLFVSHDMSAIRSLCNRLIVLNNGTMVYTGDVSEGINFYLEDNKQSSKNKVVSKNGVEVKNIGIEQKGIDVNIVESYEPAKIKIDLRFTETIPVDFKLELFIKDSFDQPLSTISSWLNSITLTPKSNDVAIEIELPYGFSFKEGSYSLMLRAFTSSNIDFYDIYEFTVINSNRTLYKFPMKPMHGKVFTPSIWRFTNEK